MCRTRPVLEFEYFQYGGYALRCGRIFDPARVPVGMYVDGKPTPDGVSITRWWRGRGIPATRDGLAGILGAAGVPTTAGMLDRSLGLSLSDQYWVRPADRDDLDWHAINFFHNDFDERLGRALMAGNPSDTLDMNTPAPIYDSGASLWNGMDPDLIDNSDYPAKPFRLDTAGDKPNALWQLSLVKDWDRYDLHVLDRIPDIARDQLSHNGRLSDKLTGRIALTIKARTRIIRDMRDHATRRHTTTPAQPLPMPDPTQPETDPQANPPAARLG